MQRGGSSMAYEVLFVEAGTRTYEGTQEMAAKMEKQFDMEIVFEKNGTYVFAAPMQAIIYELDDDGSILSQCDPGPYIRNVTGKRVTRKIVRKLLKELNEGIVDFDNVCDAAMNYDEE